MKSEVIVFDETNHKYFVNGVEFPSVTTILNSLNDYAYLDTKLLQRAAKFGTAVHRATELFDLNTLDIDALDPELLPYVESWDQFLDHYKPTILSIEQRVASNYGYAGTLDRYCEINGKHILLDIKSGTTVPKYTALQLAAYAQALKEGGGLVDRRWVVHLQRCRYKVQEFNDTTDFLTFKSALNLYRWAKKHY